MIKVSELTVAQVEAIEVRSEVGFDKWTDRRSSKAALYGSMLVELGGRSEAEVGAMTMREMVDAVRDLIDLGA